MLFPVLISVFIALASSRPSSETLDVDTTKDCGCTEEPSVQCGCCVTFHIEDNYTVCSNLTYVEEEVGVRLTVTFDDIVLINETLSVLRCDLFCNHNNDCIQFTCEDIMSSRESSPGRNPPPLCQGIVGVADICVQAYNISYKDKFGGCMRITGTLLIKVLDVELGCFYLPLKNEITEEINHSIFQPTNDPRQGTVQELKEWQSAEHSGAEELEGSTLVQ